MSPNHRASALLAAAITKNAAKIDRFFAGLFLVQWVSRIALAWVKPAHEDDLFTAVFVGAFVASMPTLLVVWKPGLRATRHAVAVTQMLYGALLVHLTKGAYATQVHVFLSLALLALYRDPAVVLTGALIGVLHAFVLEGASAGLVWSMWIACATAVLAYVAHRGRADLAVIAGHSVDAEKMSADALAAMSQQIREPMAAILGSADILLEDRQSVDPRSYVQRIRRNGQQLLETLDEAADATQLVPPPRERLSLVDPPRRRLDCSALLVEDDLDNQKILTDHLVRSGVSVVIASNGALALVEVAAAAERGKPFDVVLMDLRMPVMDGYEATAELRRRGFAGPILALTARISKGDRRRCLEAGCTDYLTKPVSRDRLIQAVANHALGSAATVPPPATTDQTEPIYSDHADGGDMAELLGGYVARLRQYAVDIETVHASGDLDELARIAHRLRGSAGSFGFMPISNAAAALEDAIEAKRDTESSLVELASLCRRASTRSAAAAAA